MRAILQILILIIFYPIVSKSQQTSLMRSLDPKIEKCSIQDLQFINVNSLKQYTSDDNQRFDLSGMVNYQGKTLVIADKEWNNYIYEVIDLSKSFKCIPFEKLCPDFNIDIEGIEYANNHFYIIEEYTSDVYEISLGNCKMQKVLIPWEKYNIDRSNWGNAGFEGIAIDQANQILYLAKERDPRRLFEVDLKTMVISEPFQEQLAEGGGLDIADLKFENGNLYLLERGLGQVTKINITTKEKVSFSFQYVVYNDGKRLFVNDNPQFGMAEALMLTDKEIWIGIDNNGNQVSEYGKSIGLHEGNKTAIFVFQRPLGF